jgi:hypothetical protein
VELVVSACSRAVTNKRREGPALDGGDDVEGDVSAKW